ncbi:OmpA family protein [Hyphomicrobium sp.]|uniref:OmpA family protein n=1 Tax=Hyphomicrobium sp. TaxID=82 RepID=UPI000F9BFC48|nr:OmpA family protein [Hyphomicrobium sp.]RUP00700.1 MAG: BON domain-containing protein [Hyphomicrobium sp.]
MRCNPTYWLLGLVPIAMLSWVAVQLEQTNIELDLSRRAEDALRRSGFSWANPHFAGRDAVVTGRAADERDPAGALSSLRNVWGVRVASDRSELIDSVADYRWSATASGDGRVDLQGEVPSEEVREALLAAAHRDFAGQTVSDGMRLARGSFNREAWLAGATFGLKNLSELKRGEARLAVLDLSIAGEARTSEAYRSVRAALAERRPAGIGLSQENVTPPVARPFIWSIKKSGAGLSLAGFTRSDEERERIGVRAKQLFGGMTVADNTDIADGAPEGWEKAVMVALDQLAQLRTGDVAIRDREMMFSGEAPNEQVASAVKRTLKLQVPQNFRILEQVRFPRPDVALPSSGYVMGIVNSGASLDLVGMVPSEAARGALIDAIKARFPGRAVNDKTQVAPGAPDGWQQCVVAGLSSLPRLKKGKSVLTDRKLELSGETDDYAASQAVPSDVKAAAGQTCETTTDIAFTGQMKTDLTWKAIREPNGMVTIAGEAPDDASRQRLIEIAQQIYAGSSVTDNMKIVGASSEPWSSAAHLGLEEMARLKNGEVSIAGKEFVIKGAAESDQVASDIRSVLSTDLPPGFKSRDEITVMSVEEKAADSCQTLMRQASAKGTINFARAKADLTPDSSQTLRDLAQIANECPSFKIQIEGHTDAEGTDERNQRLSDRRARAVADFLSENGVDPRRLTTIGYGATRPIADNASEEGRAKNRRIEFTVKVN